MQDVEIRDDNNLMCQSLQYVSPTPQKFCIERHCSGSGHGSPPHVVNVGTSVGNAVVGISVGTSSGEMVKAYTCSQTKLMGACTYFPSSRLLIATKCSQVLISQTLRLLGASELWSQATGKLSLMNRL